jgi:hypothetical protein
MKRGITPERARQLDKLFCQIMTQFPTDMREVEYLTAVIISARDRWRKDDQAGEVEMSAPVTETPRLAWSNSY